MPRIKYYTKDGTLVPGVTTVLGQVLAKPALLAWANKIGLQGIEMGKYVDDKAEIGTLAHSMVLAHWTNEKYETNKYSNDQISLAENAYLKYLEWEKGKKIEPVLIEQSLISETGFGGTPDFYGRIDNVLTLLDLKTGKGIYGDYFYQLSGYRALLLENKYDLPINHTILQIGRDETEGFGIQTRTNLDNEFIIFEACLKIYRTKKILDKK